MVRKSKPESRGEIRRARIWLFKLGVTSDRRDRLQPGIIVRREQSLLTVGQLSQCVVICESCEREILNDDRVQRTPRGRTICEDCAQDTYVDVPLN